MILLRHTGIPVRNGNIDNDRTTTTKAASMRKQLGTKNSKSNEGRQGKNGGDKADYIRSVAELREEGRMRRGRPMLRWEDCVRRDERKAGEKEVGRIRKETAGGKDYQMMRWRSCGQHLKHLDTGKKRKR